MATVATAAMAYPTRDETTDQSRGLAKRPLPAPGAARKAVIARVIKERLDLGLTIAQNARDRLDCDAGALSRFETGLGPLPARATEALRRLRPEWDGLLGRMEAEVVRERLVQRLADRADRATPAPETAPAR